MNMKVLNLVLLGLCMIMYVVMGLAGIQVSAWNALLWVLVIFISDLAEYFEGK